MKNLSLWAQLIFQYHKEVDALKEAKCASDKKIGTTKRGIGPAYADKAHRVGIRGIELTNLVKLEKLFREQALSYNKVFADAGVAELDIDAEWLKAKTAAEYLAPFVKDTVLTVNRAIKAGKKILCEGAQGMWLDIDHGTYPYVTSSNTTSGGACTGAGIAPKHIGTVWGVMKTYTTRVGEGPFPTELLDSSGEELRQAGGEFGATTGRPRRCGWFDAVASSYSCLVNGVDNLAMTKMDVLDYLDELKICTAYKIDGKITKDMPTSSEILTKVEPIYETMPGWNCPTTEIRKWEDLPVNAQKYLERIAELVDARIAIVSVGPKREQTFSV